MVVEPVAAGPVQLGARRVAPDVSEVVVGPHDGDVIGKLEPAVIEGKDLLVGDEQLQAVAAAVAELVDKEAPLVGDDAAEQVDPRPVPTDLGERVVPVDRGGGEAGVVDAAHADGPRHLVAAVLPDTPTPVLDELVAVAAGKGVVVGCPALELVLVAAQEHVAVAGADDDAEVVCQASVRRIEVEGVDVHGRPDVVALQTEHQFEQPRVRLRSDGVVAGVLLRPAFELLLVVDEDAAVGDPWPVGVPGFRAEPHLGAGTHRDVPEPVPGRDAHGLAQVVDPEDRAAPVRPDDVEGLPHGLDQEGLPAQVPGLVPEDVSAVPAPWPASWRWVEASTPTPSPPITPTVF